MNKRLLGSVGLSCVASAAVVLGFVTACTTDYQKGLDDPLYGPPNALAGTQTPGGTNEFVTGGGADGGTPGASSGGPSILCVKNGGAVVDGGTCAVSFKNDILAIFGTNNCAASTDCHGGATPKYKPRIEPSDGPGTWATFAAFQVGATPYINPCSTDKAQSAIACNVAATGTCGTKMPYGSGQVAPADIAKIETWLACGSPNN